MPLYDLSDRFNSIRPLIASDRRLKKSARTGQAFLIEN